MGNTLPPHTLHAWIMIMIIILILPEISSPFPPTLPFPSTPPSSSCPSSPIPLPPPTSLRPIPPLSLFGSGQCSTFKAAQMQKSSCCRVSSRIKVAQMQTSTLGSFSSGQCSTIKAAQMEASSRLRVLKVSAEQHSQHNSNLDNLPWVRSQVAQALAYIHWSYMFGSRLDWIRWTLFMFRVHKHIFQLYPKEVQCVEKGFRVFSMTDRDDGKKEQKRMYVCNITYYDIDHIDYV